MAIDKVMVCQPWIWWFLLPMIVATPVQAGGLASPGCMAGGETAVVASVDSRLDLRLDDGRTVHLPGIAVPDGAGPAQHDLAAWLTRATVTVAPLRLDPDRWGRTVALVFAAPDDDASHPVSVVEALIGSGRVLARPDPALGACWPGNLLLEREAERQGVGLWATASVLVPGDAAARSARAGAMAIVAGRVVSVRDGRARLYLRLADEGASGMVAALSPMLVRRLTKAGTDPHGWTGRHLRVRGLLDDRWGWQIEVTEPQQIEVDAP